jgi:hypothetical protein
MDLHLDFWNHDLQAAIVNTFSLYKRIQRLTDDGGEVLHRDFREMADGASIPLNMLKPERHHRYYEYDTQESRICGKVFNTIIPWTMITWLPAIAGCALKVSKEGNTIWPEEYLDDEWWKQEDFGLKPNWDWLSKLLEFTDYLLSVYGHNRMVSLEMFSRGPGDLLINVLGAERSYLSMYDHPKELLELFLKLADIHVSWSSEQLKRIPRYYNGYCNQWGIWAPAQVTRIQEDFAVNISEQHFREFFIPAAQRIIAASDYQVFHTHSGIPEYSRWVSTIPDLKVVEMTIDPISPSVEELVPIWKDILSRKSLIVSGSFTQRQVDYIIANLDPSGLFLDIELLR